MKKFVIISVLLAAAPAIEGEIDNVKDPRNDAQPNQFPWQVGVMASKFCGGAVISADFILTAAHCLHEARSILIMYGTLNLEDTSASVILSETHMIHEDYDHETRRNDIGLVQLLDPIIFDDNVAAVTLDLDDILKAGTGLTVAGWGTISTEDSGEPVYDVLSYIDIRVVKDADCAAAYGPELVQNGTFCTQTGFPVKNPCRGDGGDGVVFYKDSIPIHVGIYTYLNKDGCQNPDFPAVFVKTAYYIDWIKSKTGLYQQ